MILIVPIFILGRSIYTKGYHIIREEIETTNSSQLSWYADFLDNEIVRIQKLQSDFAMSDELNYYINTYPIIDSFEKFQYMLRIEDQLTLLKNSSAYIDNVILHIPSIEKTISSNNGVDQLWNDWRDALKNYQGMAPTGTTSTSDAIFMDIQYPATLNGGQNPLFVMEIILSNSSISEVLEGILSFPNSSVSLTDENGIFQLTCSSPDFDPENSQFITTSAELSALNMQLSSKIPTEYIYENIQYYQYFFAGYVLLSIIAIFLFVFIIKKVIHQPLHNLVGAIQKIEAGDYSAEISYQNKDEFNYLYLSFNKMARSLQELIHQVYEQKLLTQNAELKQLQAQINPHFLYNSFFNIYRLAQDQDCENIAVFSQYLGNYYQYITRNSTNEVPLGDEYGHAETYCNIQMMRFHNHLKLYKDDLPDNLKSIQVPRLIIQPLIENAFEHGLSKVEMPELFIRIRQEDSALLISVEDNGPPVDEKSFQQLIDKLNSNDSTLETTAIINIHRRLRLKFGPSSGVSVKRKESGGFCVTLCIPLPPE